MEYFIKKMWMSVILSILVLATTVTSTYAWYAMHRTNNVEEFSFNINGGASLKISTDGIHFYDSLSDLDVKKAVLNKRGISASGLDEKSIDKLFNINLKPITPKDYNVLSSGFEGIEGTFVNDYEYISFDFYLATNTLATADGSLSVNFTNSITLDSSDSYISTSILDFNNSQFPFEKESMSSNIRINAKNAMRLGLESYDVTDIGAKSSKTTPISTIYDFGGSAPNVNDGLYNFGGINASYNMALDVYNRMMDKPLTLPENDRNDVFLDSNTIISETEGFTSGKMKKFTAYLWLEGWDADCVTELSGSTFSFGLEMETIIKQ